MTRFAGTGAVGGTGSGGWDGCDGCEIGENCWRRAAGHAQQLVTARLAAAPTDGPRLAAAREALQPATVSWRNISVVQRPATNNALAVRVPERSDNPTCLAWQVCLARRTRVRAGAFWIMVLDTCTIDNTTRTDYARLAQTEPHGQPPATTVSHLSLSMGRAVSQTQSRPALRSHTFTQRHARARAPPPLPRGAPQ